MSTQFYPPRSPITSVRVETLGGHNHIGIWINHAKSGELVMRVEETAEFMRNLFSEIASFLGTSNGLLNVYDNVPDDGCVMSEYGEIFTVKQVK